MIAIQHVEYFPARSADIARGLLGFASFQCESLFVEAAVRRTVDGRLYLSFPARYDHMGRRISRLRPADQESREEIERAVLSAIGLDGGSR